MAVTFTGVQPANVGTDGWDIAIGYVDPTTQVCNMVGYTLAPGSEYTVGSDIQDEQHLVQVSSPNSTDRFTRYPRVSQGDWTHGGRQLVFTDPMAYYSSTGLETVYAGELRLSQKNDVGITYSSAGRPVQRGLLCGDGYYSYFAADDSTGTKDLIVTGPSGATWGTLPGNPSIYGLLATPAGVFAATAVGIFRVNPANIAASVLWTNDSVTIATCFNMGYFNGALYYLKTTGQICKIASATGAAGVVVYTPPVADPIPNVLCSSANGLFFLCNAFMGGNLVFNSNLLFTFDGTTATRVTELIDANVTGAINVNGTVYIMAAGFTIFPQYRLYALNGSTLTLIDNRPLLPPDLALPFQYAATAPNYYGNVSMSTDGFFLYYALYNYPVVKYNPANGSFSEPLTYPIPGTGQAYPVHSYCPAPPTETYVSSPGTSSVIITIPSSFIHDSEAVMGQGSLITSYFDLATPDVVKAFSSVSLEPAPTVSLYYTTPPTIANYAVSFRIDSNLSWTPLTLQADPNTGLFIGYLPAVTKGRKIQFQITLIASIGCHPKLRVFSVKAALGRVFSMTLACRRNQLSRAGRPDPQGITSQARLANISNARNIAAGNLYLYICDPSVANGVSTVTAHIEDYTRINSGGTAPTLHSTQSESPELEADLKLMLVEDL